MSDCFTILNIVQNAEKEMEIYCLINEQNVKIIRKVPEKYVKTGFCYFADMAFSPETERIFQNLRLYVNVLYGAKRRI